MTRPLQSHARARAFGLALILLALAAAVAGCVGSAPLEGASARDTPMSAPSEAGRGDHTLLISTPHGPDGEPLEGAAVTLRWGRDDGLALRTDADGQAVAHVPADTTIQATAWLNGYTEERPSPLVTGGDGRTTALEIPLYREHVELRLEGVLTPAAVSGDRLGVSEWAWLEPQEALFGDTPAAQHEYMRRMVGFSATLKWSNGPAGAGDLGLGMDPTQETPSAVQDGGDQYAPGEHQEQAFLGFSQIYDLGWREAQTLHVGPGTGTGYVAPIGLAYTVEVTGHFQGDLDRSNGTPGPGALAGLAAAAVAAVALRRRGGA